MVPSPSLSPERNLILASLSKRDRAALRPHLEYAGLPLRMQLERANHPIRQVYFPESGFASVVANGAGERSIEVGMIGREGVTRVTEAGFRGLYGRAWQTAWMVPH